MVNRDTSIAKTEHASEKPEKSGTYAPLLVDLFDELTKEYNIPIVMPHLDLNEVVYLTSDETYVSRYENAFLETLLDGSTTRTIGVKITDLASLIDTLLETPDTREFIVERLRKYDIGC